MKNLDSDAWRAFHRIGQRLLPHLGKQITNHSGLTPAEYVVLLAVYESDFSTLNLNVLANQLGWEISRMSHQVTRMHENGLLKKTKNKEDSRCFNVSLTSLGKSQIIKAIPLQSIEINHCFSEILTKSQKETLIEISKIISDHLDTHHSLTQKILQKKAS